MRAQHLKGIAIHLDARNSEGAREVKSDSATGGRAARDGTEFIANCTLESEGALMLRFEVDVGVGGVGLVNARGPEGTKVVDDRSFCTWVGGIVVGDVGKGRFERAAKVFSSKVAADQA